MDEKVTCAVCGALVSAKAKFCTQCGSKMPVQKEISQNNVYCRHCGTKIQDAKMGAFCPKCGQSIYAREGAIPQGCSEDSDIIVPMQPINLALQQISSMFTSKGRIGRKQFAIRLAISCACMSIFFILVGFMLDGGTAATITAAGIILVLWGCFKFSRRLHTVYLQYKKWMWCFFGILFILGAITGTLGHGKAKYAAVLTMLVFFVCCIMLAACGVYNLLLGIRRCHDVNHTGYLILLLFIPIVGSIFALYLLCAKGTIGLNQYGDDPLLHNGPE